MVSSFLKHINPADRARTWCSLNASLNNKQALYFDHCAYIYSVDKTTSWQNYFETLRWWWPDDFWPKLKRYEWRKVCDGDKDILEYRHIDDGSHTTIEAFAYSLEECLADIAAADLVYTPIADVFPVPMNLPGMKRLIGLVTHAATPLDRITGAVERVRKHAFSNAPGSIP